LKLNSKGGVTGMRFLIVDDESVIRRGLTKVLSSSGNCDTASNGKEALDCFKSAIDSVEPYNLILLDVQMEEMDGQETLKNIRKLENERGIPDFKKVKIIMATSCDDTENIKYAFSSGCDDYILKPVDINVLALKIKQLLQL